MIIGLDGNEANVKNRVGSGQYAYAMLCEFAKNKNHRFTVFLKDKPLSDLPKESEHFHYKIFGPKKLWTQIALPISLTISPKIDLFMSLGHYGPRFSRVPYIVTIFDLSFLHFPDLFNKDDLYQLTNWSKYSIKNSKHVITISNASKKDIQKSYSIEPSKVSVTHMGYNKSIFKPQTKSKIDQAKSKYKVVGDYIIFVGTLQPRKNISKLLEAHAKIGKKNNLSLVIVGKKGWMYDEIFNKVKNLKLEKSVIFTDFVPDADLPQLISGATAYVLPSLFEGFGIPVIEAQACGTPVVVSNTSSLPEVVRESGVLVDPESVESIAEGIEKIIKNPNLASTLSKNGLKNVNRFSWEKCAQQTLIIAEDLKKL